MAKKRRSVDNTGRNGRNTSRYSERTATNRLGSFCLVFQALVSIVFMIVVILLDMLPMNYLALVAAILFFLWCIAFTTQAVRKKRGTAGKIFSLLMICVLTFGAYNIAQANNMLSLITGGNTRVDKMAVAVLAVQFQPGASCSYADDDMEGFRLCGHSVHVRTSLRAVRLL